MTILGASKKKMSFEEFKFISPGDIVVFVNLDSSLDFFTLGQRYEVLCTSGNMIIVKDDRGMERRSHFNNFTIHCGRQGEAEVLVKGSVGKSLRKNIGGDFGKYQNK